MKVTNNFVVAISFLLSVYVLVLVVVWNVTDTDEYTAYSEQTDGYDASIDSVISMDSGSYVITIDGTDYKLTADDYNTYVNDDESVHATVHDLTVAKVKNRIRHPKQELDANVCTTSIVTMPWQDFDPEKCAISVANDTDKKSELKWESAHINLKDYTRLEKDND